MSGGGYVPELPTEVEGYCFNKSTFESTFRW